MSQISIFDEKGDLSINTELTNKKKQNSAKIKSEKNKTIDFTEEEGLKYINKCVIIDNIKSININDIINKTIMGDTFILLKQIPSSSVDLIIVDPPYNLSKNYHGNKFSKTTPFEYKQYTSKWLLECKRIMKDNATIYVCCDWESSLVIGELMFELFHVQNRITWQREKGRGSLYNWKNGMEDIWFGTKSTNYIFNVDKVMCRRHVIAPYKVDGKPKDWEYADNGKYRNTFPSNFWDDISVPYWSMSENTEHPTQKPEKLVAKLILASSNESDIVFDPFLGSGTTSVVAKKLNRRYIGIEQNKRYCGWAEYRLELAEKDKEIQGYVNGVFWERNTSTQQQKEKKKDN
jgi:site-specific DNA-methyltransferase (adenine-specific)